MRENTFTRAAPIALLLAAAAGCGSTSFDPAMPPRPAVELPEHFLVGEPTGNATSEPTGGGFCRSPMVDPRDGERLLLVRSHAGQGDYEVASGRYGVREGEVLRLDCATGRAVGIVPRRE